MMDNVTNNDTATEELQPLLVEKYGEKAVIIIPQDQRLHFFRHTLQLQVRELLFEMDIDSIEKGGNFGDEKKAEEEELKL